MEVGKLTVQKRNVTGKGIARRLRRDGLVPGICYGTEVDAPLPITLDPKALKRALDPDKRQNTVITLSVEGESAPITVMLKDYQVDPIRRDVTHVDLIAIDATKPVETEVPVVFEGKPAGLVHGGQTHVVLREVTVRCKPADIPARLVCRIDDLDIGDALHVSDLALPEGVESVDALELAVITMTAPEKEEAPAAEAAEGEEAPAEGEAKAEGGDAKKEEKKD
jgi:large subunit ribosomal protein L25